MGRIVLIVIDMEKDFFQEDTLAKHAKVLTKAINELVIFARQYNSHIIWVRQEFEVDLSDAPLEVKRKNICITIKGTNGCELLPELDIKSEDYFIIKKRYSAFYGTELDSLLKTIDPKCIIVAGINSHACVRMTAIDAYQRNYEVIIAKDCVYSYDLEHHKISLKYMNGKIGNVMSNKEIFKKLRIN